MSVLKSVTSIKHCVKKSKIGNRNVFWSARSFSEYVEALVGHTLSHAFFKEYPEKVWALPTTLMLPDWAPKRIRICEKREPFFTGQFCGISKFGSGTLFDKIYKFVERCGSKIKLNEKISHFLQRNGRLIEIHTSKSSDSGQHYSLCISVGSYEASLLGF